MRKKLMNTALYSLGVIVFILATSLMYMGCASQFGARSKGSSLNKIQSSSNYKDGKFYNLEKTQVMDDEASAFGIIVKWIKGAKKTIPENPIETLPFDMDEFLKENNGIHSVWFGHSTVLLNVNGKIILADPVFSDNPSPIAVGNKAFSYTHTHRVENLPAIDIVIISHDHYDHLDMDSIKKLKNKVKRFLVPLGVSAHLESWGVEKGKIVELDWWESFSENKDIQFSAVPSRHFSGRSLFNRYSTLWCSWVMEIDEYKLYFSGDSGYGKHFKMIGEKYGDFDLVMMECGQYNPDWPDIHMSPEETLMAGEDLDAKFLLPIHWGKFKLSLHSWYEPVERLIAAREKGSSVNIIIPIIGDSIGLKEETEDYKWWSNESISFVN